MGEAPKKKSFLKRFSRKNKKAAKEDEPPKEVEDAPKPEEDATDEEPPKEETPVEKKPEDEPEAEPEAEAEPVEEEKPKKKGFFSRLGSKKKKETPVEETAA